ncbi:MAG: hypothetical protein ABIF87_04935 [Pseudomonadota bacterium]
MIARPTVLILGAGSSSHLGYPLGAELIANLCRLRAAKQTIDLPATYTREQLEAFLLRLSRSAHYSIDAFLETVPESAALGKYLIAHQLKHLEELDRLFPPNRPGWYQYFFNELLVEGKPEFEKNRIEVVTFNYDRSLEAYVHTVLQYRFQLSEKDATAVLEQIPIVHVHGILGGFPSTPYRPEASVDELTAISEQIQIIHEIRDRPDGFCNDSFARANEMLQGAERIFFLGFGFHPDNVRRFRFFSPESLKEREVRSTTSGMQSLDHRKRAADLAEYGFTADVFPQNGANCDLFFGRTAYFS